MGDNMGCPRKRASNIGASWRKPVCKHRVYRDILSILSQTPLKPPPSPSFYLGGGGVERSVALSDRDPSPLKMLAGASH